MVNPRSTTSKWIQTATLVCLALVLTGVIFLIEISAPIEMAFGAMYCVVILYSWILPGRLTSLIVGLVCTGLITISLFLVSDTEGYGDIAGVNSVISLVTVWTCVSMMTLAKRSFRELESTRDELELKVKDRTAELLDREESLKDAQSIAKIGNWTWDLPKDIVTWSDQMFEILEIFKFEKTGRADDILRFVHPDDIEEVKQIISYVLKEKNAIPYEFRIITMSGKLKHLRSEVKLMVDENANIIKLFGTLQDITEQVQRNNEFNAFWNNSLEFMCIVNTNGYFERLNPKWEEILGYTPAELMSKPFVDFIHNEDKNTTLIEVAELAGGKNKSQFRNRYRTKSGEYKWFLWSMAIDRDLNLLYATARDVTNDIINQKQLESYAHSLETKNKELEQFAYIASHDLQEPLHTVISLSDMLENKYSNKLDNNANKFLSFIRDASLRMSELVKGLLDYSHIGRNIELKIIDCNSLLKNVQMDLMAKIKGTNAKIEISTLPAINGYEIELRLLFQNLISNALKFRKADKAPIIDISVEKLEGGWRFAIQDNGIGIPEKHQEKIFTIFQRLHNKSEYKGTGIGLAHCRKIVELHKGKIWVESQPDVGSTFYIFIPN